MSDVKPECITFCPKCSQETFEVDIEDSGTESTSEGVNHWFEGMGKCSNCDHESFHSDGSL